jgi:hypothetical protein
MVHPSHIDSRDKGGNIKDFLAFRRLITPIFIQTVFWIGIVGILVLGIVAIVEGIRDESDVGAVILGVLILIFGPIIWRVFCEIWILTFRTIQTLANARNIITEKRREDKFSTDQD